MSLVCEGCGKETHQVEHIKLPEWYAIYVCHDCKVALVKLPITVIIKLIKSEKQVTFIKADT